MPLREETSSADKSTKRETRNRQFPNDVEPVAEKKEGGFLAAMECWQYREEQPEGDETHSDDESCFEHET
jgi:hypothetical protein